MTADDIMKDLTGGDVGAYMTDMLAKQAMSPVYWEEIIKRFDGGRSEGYYRSGSGKNSDRTHEKDVPWT